MKFYEKFYLVLLYLFAFSTAFSEFPYKCDKSREKVILADFKIQIIPKNAFYDCTSVKEIRLNHLKVETIEIGAFNNLPKLSKVSISYNLIHSLPSDICRNNQLKYLDIHSNQFHVIPSIQCQTLKTLKLTSNQLKEINFPNNSNLLNLNRLDLNYNKIEKIDRSDFRNFAKGSLHSLKLRRNPLRISYGAFFHLRKHLRHLDVSENENLTSEDFSNLLGSFDHVRHKKKWHLELYVKKCTIKNITLSMFEPAKHIYFTRLILTNNQIDYIEQGFGSITLKYLLLDKNRLSYIKENNFIKIKGLQRLNLNNNLIHSIHRNAFSGLVNLKYLHLVGNRLMNLEMIITKPIAGLKTMFIDENYLNSLTVCGNKPNKTIFLFNVENICINRSTCLSVFNNSINYSFKLDISLPVCSKSYIPNNKSMIKNQQKSLIEPKNHNNLLYLYISLILIPVFIVIISVICFKRKYIKLCMKTSTPRHRASPMKIKMPDTNNIYESLPNIKFDSTIETPNLMS